MPARRRLVLHIGTHKTASTSIQTMVADNPDHFADLYYPQSGRVGHAQHNIAWQFCSHPNYDPALGTVEDLVAELRRERPARVLVSSEDFESIYDPAEIARLHQALAPLRYEMHVVAVLRDRPGYLESRYPEALKHGEQRSFDTYADLDASDDIRFILDYDALLSRFAASFGEGRVHAFEYRPEDAVERFFAVCSTLLGSSYTPVSGWPRVNEREESVRNDQRITLSPEQRAGIAAVFGARTVPEDFDIERQG
jgi:hypothetical protein